MLHKGYSLSGTQLMAYQHRLVGIFRLGPALNIANLNCQRLKGSSDRAKCPDQQTCCTANPANLLHVCLTLTGMLSVRGPSP
mmetsp:Transcript_144818/g.252498  ORF Transcript_144818/g.252498 Transcript_144818/m.252498 type:complete len:82 (-) Transcript_144818:280-525(-)